MTVTEVTGTGDGGKGYSYVYVGETLQLNCTLSESISWDAEDLEFVLDNDFYVSFSRTLLCLAFLL